MSIMPKPQDCHVAVIGAGPAGLAMTKSLLEEGFQVSTFEQRDGPGGIWHFTEDPSITSVTSRTRSQLSRFMTPFTDFPHDSNISRHPSAAELGDYYQKYADAFDLNAKITYNATIKSITRNHETSQWLVCITGEDVPRAFDKVVLASGTENIPRWPRIDDIEVFGGEYIHGQSYKNPEKYVQKRVLVIGQGNSAGDCATEISTHASQVYMSHHRSALILPRNVDGKRFDSVASYKLVQFSFVLGRYAPFLHRWVCSLAFDAASRSAWGELDPEWGFDNEYLFASNVSTIMFSDGLVPALKAGSIISVPSVARVVGPRAVQLTDGTTIEDLDAIISCTGYESSLPHLLSSDIVPFTRSAPDVPPLPHLYHNIFPIQYADSLAILGYSAFMDNAAICRELAGMAVAQIWAGKSTLPSRAEMERQVQRHFKWFANRCRTNAPVSQIAGLVEPYTWMHFVHEKAGTGVQEKLGWTWEGLKFSIRHPKLYLQLAYGVRSPHIYRLFETGKRKAWSGALEAIQRVNRDSEQDLEESVRQWKAAKDA